MTAGTPQSKFENFETWLGYKLDIVGHSRERGDGGRGEEGGGVYNVR